MADEYLVAIKLKADGTPEVVREFGKLRDAMDDLDRVSKQTSSTSRNLGLDLGALGSVAAGAISAFAVSEVVGLALEMRELGAEVRLTQSTFEELAGGQGAATEMISAMREATKGAVADFELMAAANKLMLTGVSDSSSEIAELTSQAIILGRAMGAGPEEALDNLNAALLNLSYERLDMLGVSSAAVRDRVKELTAAGLDMNAAFAQATTEEMANSVEKLGDSADLAFSEVDQLLVRLDNFKNNLAAGIAQGFEDIAGAINDVWDAAEGRQRDVQQAELEIEAEATAEIASMETWQAVRDQLNSEVAPVLGREFSDTFVQAAVESIKERGFGANIEDVAEGMGTHGIGIFAPATEDEYGDTIEAIAFIMTALEREEAARREALRAQQEQALYAQRAANYQQDAADLAAIEAAERERAAEAAAEQARIEAELTARVGARAIMGDLNEGRGLMNQPRGTVGGPLDSTALFTLAEVQQLQENLELATENLAMLQNMAEQYPGLVDAADLENLEGYVEEMEGMVSTAERGYQATERMRGSLQALFGQGSGGALGQIGDELSAFLSEQGTDESALEALNQTFALGSGRETELSQQFENEVLPTLAAIYEQYGADAALSAAQAYQDGVMVAWQSGDFSFDPASLLGFEMGVDKFGNETLLPTGGPTIPSVIGGAPVEGGRPFEGWFGGGGEEGAAPEEMMPDMTPLQTQMSEIQTSGEAFSAALVAAGEPAGKLAGTSAAFAANLGVAETSTLSIEKHLHDLAANTQTVTVKLDVDTTNVPTELKMLFRGLVEDVVRENGGIVPGAEGSGVKP